MGAHLCEWLRLSSAPAQGLAHCFASNGLLLIFPKASHGLFHRQHLAA